MVVRPRRAAPHQLERHPPVEARLSRLVDNAHTAAAQLALELEAGNHRQASKSARETSSGTDALFGTLSF